MDKFEGEGIAKRKAGLGYNRKRLYCSLIEFGEEFNLSSLFQAGNEEITKRRYNLIEKKKKEDVNEE